MWCVKACGMSDRASAVLRAEPKPFRDKKSETTRMDKGKCVALDVISGFASVVEELA